MRDFRKEPPAQEPQPELLSDEELAARLRSEATPPPAFDPTAAAAPLTESAPPLPDSALPVAPTTPAPAAPLAPATPAPVNLPITPAELRRLITLAGVTKMVEIQLIEKLVFNGKLAAAKIDDFVKGAHATGQSLVEHAILSRLITDVESFNLMADLYGMKVVELSKENIEEDLVRMIKPDQAREWQLLPYSRDPLGRLLVAISDPSNIHAREGLQRTLPREEIIWRYTSERELNRAFARVFSDESAIEVASVIDELASQITETTATNFRVRDTAAEAPIIKLVDTIIQRADRLEASDIHIEPKEHTTSVRLRIDGLLRPITQVPAGEPTNQLVARIKTLARMRTDLRTKQQDGRITAKIGSKSLELRVVSLPTIYGEQITMRLLDQQKAMLTLEQLGMSSDNLMRYEQAIHLPHGCAIITGPTGSGKSTTLYSSAVRVVKPEIKFISIEDPVEYRLDGITQIDVSSKHESALTFSDALKGILRSDPDIVMVGEIRDRETAQTAVEASLTGHFIYSTLHTNDALGAITRLQRMGIEPFLVAEAVCVIVAQRLVRVLCPECRQPFHADATYLRGLYAPAAAIAEAEATGGVELYRASERGTCEMCGGRGYRGRTGVHEVITINDAIKDGIVEGVGVHELEKLARAADMHSLREDCFRKVRAGVTSMEELARVVI